MCICDSCLPYATMAGRGDGLLVLLLIQQNNLRFRQLALEEELLRRRRRRRLAFWVRPWLFVPRRLMCGHYRRLMRELRMEDTASFCNFKFMRMEPKMFDELVDSSSPRITLQDTNWRKALEPGVQEWSCSMSHHSWRMENRCWCVWKNMEHPSCCRCIGWEARRPS